MFKFSTKSKSILLTCHPDLQRVFNKVIMYYDCSILSGHRNKDDQDELFRKGLSKKSGGTSKHNNSPSLAVDVAPYDSEIKGIDWDGDNDLHDQTFMDLGHFELIIKG